MSGSIRLSALPFLECDSGILKVADGYCNARCPICVPGRRKGGRRKVAKGDKAQEHSHPNPSSPKSSLAPRPKASPATSQAQIAPSGLPLGERSHQPLCWRQGPVWLYENLDFHLFRWRQRIAHVWDVLPSKLGRGTSHVLFTGPDCQQYTHPNFLLWGSPCYQEKGEFCENNGAFITQILPFTIYHATLVLAYFSLSTKLLYFWICFRGYYRNSTLLLS